MIKVYKNLNEVINDIGLAETKNKLSRLFNFDNNDEDIETQLEYKNDEDKSMIWIINNDNLLINIFDYEFDRIIEAL
tara:strand:- start:2657 stop:2887 length:231 start_codon:yes stop_codon:yes gene_type:complete